THSFYAKLLAVKRVTSNNLGGNKAGRPHKGCLLRCLSRVRRKSHARFLGGNGVERPLTYPIG
ncbi:MAG: hypothetical protein KKG10_08745, partial [Proteobacteria bacterium]|nr:hypothetical protein [Pseudomonadota bacterium]